ncbi:aspartate aminotransferase family protein [Halegenticoccus soli]|uniref:aspartate aminotransferase family protein n=1 Tax=Halegenticoccus soli TaxID=1985678 RepID=UPI000C6D7282|nr:aspartate aminotransferase family protein [Halegenticoccus soli]
MQLWPDIESEYVERTPTSERLHRETRAHVPAGVASTFRNWDPHPLFVERASGVHLYDVDGNAYLDFALNNGAAMVGHAHPAVNEAVADQLGDGTLYCHPHELLSEAAVEIKRRWDPIDLVRFTNSGTDSTMHAIRVARAYSGRDKILKIEGSYHGVHDYVLISKSTPEGKWGHPKRPAKLVESAGVPEQVAETVEVAPFNDLEAVESILREHRNEIGAVIVEPIVMNVAVTQPRERFLHGLRELCDEYGLVYIFDEVKTGAKVAPGGAAEYYGVEPDLVAMAKSIGGNFPVGAFGGSEEIMRTIEDDAAHFGTYNGNPLVLRALVTVLRDVLTDEAYERAYALGDALAQGYEDVMEDAGLVGHVDQVTTQGTAVFTDHEIRNYRDFQTHVDPDLQENYFFGMLNRGVMAQPHGIAQQWTISVQHDRAYVDEHLEAFKDLAPRLADEQSL